MNSVAVGVLVAVSGPEGLFGPSTRDCALLAADEINRDLDGLLGARINLEFIDVGQGSSVFMPELCRLLSDNCKALIGVHDSAVREIVSRHIQGSVPYIYTPPYEGDETGKGLFVLGETPFQQLYTALPWFIQEKRVNTWYLLGNAYKWPYTTNWLAKQFVGLLGGETLAEEYVPLGSENFDHVLRQIEELGPDAVLITLVGNDSICFNRAFAEQGLADKTIRFGPLIEENTLLGIGAEYSKGIFAASGYFSCLDTLENKNFMARYNAKFGDNAPMLNVVGQSCYDGLHLLVRLVDKAKSLEVRKLAAVVEGTTLESPRGSMTMHNGHSTKDMYLVEAEDIDFKIVKTFRGVPANAPAR
ncbi:MAG: substrate-binding domain-containing protein [Gammaproteobacteria bacterium]|nr:substrate-binding domain-containing protein [Gammaproteobacteria bacterium]